MVSDHGIDDGQQLVGNGDERGFGRFSLGLESQVEFLGDGVAADRDDGGHVEDVANLLASADDVPGSFGLSAVVGPRCHADQLADDFAVDLAEFGELADEGSGDLRSVGRHRLDDAVQLLSLGVGGDAGVEFRFEVADFLVDPDDVLFDALAGAFFGGAAAAVGFHGSHFDELIGVQSVSKQDQ